MGDHLKNKTEGIDAVLSCKPLSDAARRALAEAEARRAKESVAELPKEHLGREGPEPTRFGDWEHKGLISDF